MSHCFLFKNECLFQKATHEHYEREVDKLNYNIYLE